MKLRDLIEQYGEYEVLDNGNPVMTATKKDVRGFTDVLFLKKPKQKTVWDLEKGDKYFYTYGNSVYYAYWGNSEYYDQLRTLAGDIFLTKEEAEKDAERRVVETLLLKYGGRRWFIKGKSNMFVHYDTRTKKLRYDLKTLLPVQGAIYFDDFEKLDKAVKAIGEERIINALFEVR